MQINADVINAALTKLESIADSVKSGESDVIKNEVAKVKAELIRGADEAVNVAQAVKDTIGQVQS
jgi:hypothetical protein